MKDEKKRKREKDIEWKVIDNKNEMTLCVGVYKFEEKKGIKSQNAKVYQ